MSSYNENLHSTVVASLNDQELEVQHIEAQKEASMFTLYYAQGARITASEQLGIATKKYEKQEKIMHANIVDNNISTNVLASAEVENTTVTQSVTNSAVSAANIEVATNAIIKLASDTGSIYSIVNAADYGSQIFEEAKYAKCLMDETAYLAEKTSQHAMEASAFSAEISSSSLEEKAAGTDASIKSLLEIVTNEFNDISEVVDKDNQVLSEAHVVEKKAEGELEDISGEAIATVDAYELNNEELNLDLKVFDETNTKYNVSFNNYKPAFYPFQCTDTDQPINLELSWDPYPVKEYYIMLVKDSRKATFTVNTAQSSYKKNKRSVQVALPIITEPIPENVIFDVEVSITELYDSDGDELKLGEEYVVFVYAILEDEYKKLINSFDDYITAPSGTFKLTSQLEKALDLSITSGVTPEEFTFDVRQESFINIEDIEYRCMFLPSDAELTLGLLTQSGLNDLEKYAKYLEKMAGDYDKEYAKKQSELTLLKVQMKAHNQYLAKNHVGGDAEVSDQSRLDEQYRADLNAKIEKHQGDLKSLDAKKSAYGSGIFPAVIDATGRFLFNLGIAEQVPAGSYVVAENIEYNVTNEDDAYITGKATVKILPDVTDNFGNRLIEEQSYIPVVLSIYVGENRKEYTNALTDYKDGSPFVYEYDSDADGTIMNQLNHALEDIEEVKEELGAKSDKKKAKTDKKDKK